MKISYLLLILGMLFVFSSLLSAAEETLWTEIDIQTPTSITRDTSGVIYTTSQGGVYQSLDQGDSWEILPGDSLDFFLPFSITVNPVTNDLFVAIESGVYRTDDDGQNWIFLGNDLVGVYAINARKDGLIVASGSPGVWISTDNGDNWVLKLGQPGSFGNGIAFAQDGTIFANSSQDGIFRSTDNAETWELITSNFSDTSIIVDVVTDTVNNIVYTAAYHQFWMQETYNRIFRSYDNGDSWELIDSVFGISLALGLDSQGNLFTGRIPTAYSPDHGDSWVDISSGIQQGNRLMDFVEAVPGKILLADQDGKLKVAYIGTVPPCCSGSRGDVDNSGNEISDISDLLYLVDFMFSSPAGPAPVCPEEADVNGTGETDISDLLYLVDYMFDSPSGPPPVNCL